MIIRILDPTMDGMLKIEDINGESCGVICFAMEYGAVPLELATVNVTFTAYMNIFGEELHHNRLKKDANI